MDALHKDLNNVYDQFTDMQGDLKVGKCKIDEEKCLGFSCLVEIVNKAAFCTLHGQSQGSARP